MKLSVRLLPLIALVLAPLGASALTLGLVLDKGGKDDKSFNSSAYEGSRRAEAELGFKLKVVEASDDNAYEPLLKALATRNYDLIVAVGVSQAEAVRKVAPQFPKVRFAIVDAEVNVPNVRSLLFEEHEGSYLVGALAAMKSKTGEVGFIGGMDIPLIRRFEVGFIAGAKKINPKIQIQSGFVGITSEAWNNPPKAKELALAQHKQGADVVFVAAGASNTGVFDAAEDKKFFAIGVDSNQNGMRPGRILTSMLKRVDLAVLNTCRDVKENKFSGGVHRGGLATSEVDFAMDEHNQSLVTPEMLTRANALKKEILQGKIRVPDHYKKQKP